MVAIRDDPFCERDALEEARRRERSATQRLALAWRLHRRTKRWVMLGWLAVMVWFTLCVWRFLWT